jgi:hypothetical protein
LKSVSGDTTSEQEKLLSDTTEYEEVTRTPMPTFPMRSMKRRLPALHAVDSTLGTVDFLRDFTRVLKGCFRNQA